jgi:uncharacterized protein
MFNPARQMQPAASPSQLKRKPFFNRSIMNTIARAVTRYPGLALLIIVTLSAAFFWVMISGSRMETNLDNYMPQDHPAFVYSDQAEAWFDIQDAVIIAIENPAGIYQPGTFDKIRKLTQALQKMPEIDDKDVTSLYTADNIVGDEDGLEVKPFFKTPPRDDEALQQIRQAVRGNEMVYGRLVSVDETVTVVIAGIKADAFSQDFYQRILDLAKSHEGPERLHVAGRPIVEGTLAYLSPKDMQRMVPIVVLVIALVLLAVTRSFKSTLLTLLVVFGSTVWTFGLMAAVGIPIYAVATMIPVMLIAIGVADGIHLYNHLHLFLQQRPDTTKKTAVLEMMQQMWKPVVMTSVTTAVGFISLTSSQVYPIKYFGIFAAFGVLTAMILSLVLIPAGIMMFGLPARRAAIKAREAIGTPFSHRFADGVLKHRWPVLIGTLAIISLSAWGTGQVWIDSSFLEKFEKDSDIVLTDRFINQHFGGTSTLNVILASNRENAFKDPDVLRLIDRVQTDLEKLPMVGGSFSLADYLKRMNMVMHADDEAWNITPETTDMVAQYLLLYEMSGDPDNLLKVVDYPYQKANLTFQLKSDTSITIKEVITAIERHLPAFSALDVDVRYAGSGYKALVFTDLILEGQILSLLTSLVLIVVLLSLMFKNLLIGFIGSVPIIITAGISFGVMGWLGVALTTTTALVSSIAVGIGIDYAVHFITRYRQSIRESDGYEPAIRLTMQHSGRAIAFNALVVIAGFLVLLTSVFPSTRELGALVSLNMFTSFVGTLTVMAILLRLFRVDHPRTHIIPGAAAASTKPSPNQPPNPS